MSELTDVVESWAAGKWDEPPVLKQNADDDAFTLRFTHTSESGELDGYIEISNSKSLVLFYIYAPNTLPDKSLTLVMDAIAMINQNMVVGNVEIVRNGVNWFRFRAGIDVEDGELSTTMLDNLLGMAISTIEKYFPAILLICFAGVMPQRAIAEAREEKAEGNQLDDLVAKADLDELLSIDDVAPSQVLAAWSTDMANAISAQADLSVWKMVGYGAVVVHDDMERARDMLRRVAIQANMRFVCIEADDVTDIPSGTHDALRKFEQTGNPFSGSTHDQSAGNGCIMRLAPVPMFFYPDRDAAIEMSGNSSLTTHGATECVEASRLFGAMLFKALEGASKDEILVGHGLGNFSSSNIQSIAQGEYRNKAESEISGIGYVVPSLEAALWCFYHTDNFKDAILRATNLGDDADTTAAICGQVAGAFYGEAGIPEDWRNKLVMHDEIRLLADHLYKHASLS